MVATMALAMIGPTPGTLIRRWQASSRGHESLDLASHRIDALIEMMPVLHQAFDHVHHARREDIGALGENVRQRLPQRTQPLAHRNPALEQEGADLVDHRRALAHQP